jgi:CRISPR-associated protein Cmr6
MMSVPALRNDISEIIGNQHASNPGLALLRYHSAIDQSGDYQEREKAIKTLTHRERLESALTVYQSAYQKWKSALDADVQWTVSTEIPARDRLFIGLGGASVLEFGVSLHPVYGLPMIPGSALKGICARYADECWGSAEEGADWQRSGELHQILFGHPDEDGKLAAAGAIDFLDAWWTPGGAGPFVAEIINPHHPDYYVNDPPKPPADWDSPNPVKMLAVAGSFLFAVRGPGYWNALAMTLLKEALAWDGIGGKTRAGYGRFGIPDFGNGGGSFDAAAGGGTIKSATPEEMRQEKIASFQREVDGVSNAQVPGSVAGFLEKIRKEEAVEIQREMLQTLIKKGQSLGKKAKFTKALKGGKTWAVSLKELCDECGVEIPS